MEINYKLNKIKEDELVNWIDNKVKELSNKVTYINNNFQYNQSFLSGNQYPNNTNSNYFNTLFPFNQHNKNGNNTKKVINILKPEQIKLKSRITQTLPVPHAKPLSTKEKDIRIAKTTNCVMLQLWDNQKLEKKLIDLVGYGVSYGSGFAKVTWNKTLGKKIISRLDLELKKMENQNYLDPSYYNKLQEMLVYKKSIYEGDVDISIVSPYEIYIENPHLEDIEDSTFLIHCRAYHREVLKKAYLLSDEDLSYENINAVTKQNNYTSSTINYSIYNNYGDNNHVLKDYITVTEYYERPTKDFPNGRFIQKVGKKITEYMELPYKIGRNEKRDIPFLKYELFKEEGNFYGYTPITNARIIQQKRNDIRNRMDSAYTTRGLNQIIAEKGSLVKSMTNRNGEIIEIKKNSRAPIQFKNQTDLREYYNEIELLNREIQSVIGLSSINPSDMPSELRSGVQLGMLYQNENLNLNEPVSNLANLTKDIMIWAIRLYQQFTFSNRFIEKQESYDLNTIEEWNKELINDNIEIKNISSLHLSRAQQQQRMQDTVAIGLYDENNKYGARNTVNLLENLGMGNIEEIDIQYKKDIDKAKRENHDVSRFQDIHVHKYDNHFLHKEEHRLFIISEEYETYIRKVGNERGVQVALKIEQKLIEHIEQHDIYIQAAQNRQLQIMEAQNRK